MNAARAEAVLVCSVRGCGGALRAKGRSLACARGHAFDRARSGYVNLLQPGDRRSRSAGDARPALEARARLHAAGFGVALDGELRRLAQRLVLGTPARILDLGTGTGERLAALCAALGADGIALDLSGAAVELGARRFPALAWVVANADRRLPIADASVALVLSLHGRRNPEECARVLAPGGHLLAALPASDDLVELRERVQGARTERERVTGFLAEHASRFELCERSRAAERRVLGSTELRDLLAATYRGERQSAAEAVQALAALEVTLAADVLLLARRP